jgi:hypothetical protein
MKLSSIKEMPVLIDVTRNKNKYIYNKMDVWFHFLFLLRSDED